jgi:hypothetical protein
MRLASPSANGQVPPPSSPADREPSLLPGTTDDAPDGPQTVQQSQPGAPQIPDASAANFDEAAPVSKPARRPIASRLFARP